MLFEPGARIGRYEVMASLGAGSMGEVYRARDPQLDREVAIKVLPSSRSIDSDVIARFELEARAAAALNHPNILAVFDVGEHDSVHFIVSELLEGQTLREYLSRRRLSPLQTIDLGLQIARGLEAAHAKGIVHRDLKPENVLVAPNGRLKILDFGLAKLAASRRLTVSDTATTILTTPGMILGTVGYMAPEQVRGQATDHRADIFALGAILYEMAGGTRAFTGETPADVMTAILKDQAPPLPPGAHVPVALERVIMRCLDKNPMARFQSASDLVFGLEGLASGSGLSEKASARAWSGLRRLPVAWATAAVFAALAGVMALRLVTHRGDGDADTLFRSSILPPEHVTFSTASPAGGLALSPDGRRLVFTAQEADGPVMLWVRSLDGMTAQLLTGTEGAFYPFWSPDGQTVAFFAGGQLKKIDVAGGSPVTLCDTPRPSILAAGGAWSADGVILFAQATSNIYRVAALGGTPVPATALDAQAGETQHWAPFFLPDGKHFLYFAVGSKDRGPDDPNGVYVASVDSTTRTRILEGGSN
ncbi:MAG: protein kinase, partial [Vicinamibacterales bacterium]